MGVSEALPQEMADAIAPPTSDPLERFFDNLNLARVGAGLVWHQIWIKGEMRRFYARLNAALATPDAMIDAMPAKQLAAEYRGLEAEAAGAMGRAAGQRLSLHDRLWRGAGGSMKTWAGEAGMAWLSSALIGQGDIVSAEPARLIRAMGAMVVGKPEIIARLATADRTAVDAMPELRACVRCLHCKVRGSLHAGTQARKPHAA